MTIYDYEGGTVDGLPRGPKRFTGITKTGVWVGLGRKRGFNGGTYAATSEGWTDTRVLFIPDDTK